MAEERAVVGAEFVHHLGDADDVVIGRANETNERFPGVLFENSDSCESGRSAGEVCIVGRPFFIELCEVGFQVEVVLDEVECFYFVLLATFR